MKKVLFDALLSLINPYDDDLPTDDEIEHRILPLVYGIAVARLGSRRTQKIFCRLNSRRYANKTEAGALVIQYLATGQKNKSEFLRGRVARNKMLSRDLRLGARGTDVNNLRRLLDRELKGPRINNLRRLLDRELKGPRSSLGQISEKKSKTKNKKDNE
jgi:hypothetical protein